MKRLKNGKENIYKNGGACLLPMRGGYCGVAIHGAGAKNCFH
ncbi:MAG: hypothetical protein ACLR56_02335 [Oscillospiraceae bacterium]